MSNKNIFNFKLIFLTIILIYIFSITSIRVYPLYKFIITNDLNHSNILEINLREYFYYSFDTKGIGIIFDYNSEINLIPKHLFIQLQKAFELRLPDTNSYINKTNNYEELIFFYFRDEKIGLHFITENISITFPNKILFPKIKYNTIKNSFIFLTKENQENIVFGKYLIDFMKLEFNEKGEFTIKNEECITKKEDL